MLFSDIKLLPYDVFGVVLSFAYNMDLKTLDNYVESTIYETRYLQVPPAWKLYLNYETGKLNWKQILEDIWSMSAVPIDLDNLFETVTMLHWTRMASLLTPGTRIFRKYHKKTVLRMIIEKRNVHEIINNVWLALNVLYAHTVQIVRQRRNDVQTCDVSSYAVFRVCSQIVTNPDRRPAQCKTHLRGCSYLVGGI